MPPLSRVLHARDPLSIDRPFRSASADRPLRSFPATLFKSLRKSPPEPVFRFGLLADAQYAAKDALFRRSKSAPNSNEPRRMAWCESLGKVDEAVRTWNAQQGMAFVLSLGDIIEGNEQYMQQMSERELRAVLSVLEQSHAPVRHILGNHCRRLSKPKLLDMLGLTKSGSYYHFAPAPGWRVVCLDTTELCGGAVDANENEKAAVARMAAEIGRPVHRFHGAVSDMQLEWLSHVLCEAREASERVIIMTHYPLRAARESHLAVNSTAILRVIEKSNAIVVAVFAGHDHCGATLLPDTRNDLKTAYITLPAMVESPCDSNAFATVTVYRDGSLDVTGHGTVPSYRVRSTS